METLYNLRVVTAYHGQSFEPQPIFDGFQGFVIASTWGTSDWVVFRTWYENDIYRTEELGIIQNEKISLDWPATQVVEFIRQEALKMIRRRYLRKVTLDQIDELLLNSAIVTPRNVPGQQHISKKSYIALKKLLKGYINEQIKLVIKPFLENDGILAIDQTIAKMIQLHER